MYHLLITHSHLKDIPLDQRRKSRSIMQSSLFLAHIEISFHIDAPLVKSFTVKLLIRWMDGMDGYEHSICFMFGTWPWFDCQTIVYHVIWMSMKGQHAVTDHDMPLWYQGLNSNLPLWVVFIIAFVKSIGWGNHATLLVICHSGAIATAWLWRLTPVPGKVENGYYTAWLFWSGRCQMFSLVGLMYIHPRMIWTKIFSVYHVLDLVHA